MKKTMFGITALLLVGLAFAFTPEGEKFTTLKIGEEAPMTDVEMVSANRDEFSLGSIAEENGLLVIFSCNTCPFVIAWEDRYPALAELAEENEIGFVLINSNEAKREGEDSMEEMMQHAEKKGYPNVPYLVDENSEVANAFGAKTTPHVFLFNKELKLVYEGAIDDNHKSSEEVETNYLMDAMNNLVQGEEIEPNQTKAVGCSIKRVKM